MSSSYASQTLAQFGSAEVDAVAHGLDAKVEQLVDAAARLARLGKAPGSGRSESQP